MSPTGYSEAMYLAKLEQELDRWKSLAMKDFLTGLWNERKLEEDLKRYTEIQKRSNIKFTVALLDIDNFKRINDTYGHEYGNKILKKVANILITSIRKYENVYRIGSGADEFVIILSHSNNPEKVINRIKKKLKRIKLSGSIGYDILRKNILTQIDRKMYNEKRKKK